MCAEVSSLTENNITMENRITKFQGVHRLILHLSAEEKDKIGVTYISLKGIKTNVFHFDITNILI